MVDEALYFFEQDVGKKVYEIEYEVTYVTKWQVLAEDRDKAFDLWLENSKLNMSTEDGHNTVCSYAKDYTQMGNIKEIAKIKYDSKDNGEVIADES